jgi:membrane associated rhomboid family serine protease
MSESVSPQSHEALLRLCAAAAPNPWYPREYAKSAGVARDSLDAPLNDLRVSGLIKLTDWTKENGQGYLLTESGEQVLRNPVYLAQVRSGLQPPPATPTSETADAPKPDVPTPYERGEAARSALYEPQPPRVMPVLLLINLIAFGFSLYVAIRANVPLGDFLSARGSPAVSAVHEAGGLSPIDLLRGEWWRLITCAFLHFGIIHLIVNMYSLWVLGQYESLWSAPRFLIIYLMSAFGGSCAAMLWNPSEGLVLAGASGAIWGLMTSLVAWFWINHSHIKSEQLANRVPNFAVLFVINVGISFLPGISASAHFGGGIVGFVVGSLLLVQRYAVPPRRTVATVLISLMPFICFAAVAEVMEKDPRWQRIKADEQARRDFEALERFKKDIVPSVNAADAGTESIRSNASILLNKLPDRRGDEAVDAMRKEIADTLKAIKKASDQIGDKPAEEEKLKQARTAALDYLAAAKAYLEDVEGLLKNKAKWTTESGQLEKVVVEKRAAWHSVRDRLQ